MSGHSEFAALRAYFDAHQEARAAITSEKFSQAMAAANSAEQSLMAFRGVRPTTLSALPPLPHAVAHVLLGDDSEDVFTADQMLSYGRAAVAAALADKSPYIGTRFVEGEVHHDPRAAG